MTITPNEALPQLEALLQEKKLSILAGSGISVDSGLPDWDGFVDHYINICEKLNESLPDHLKFTEILSDAKSHSNANLIETITALKDKVKYCQDSGADIGFFDDIINKIFYKAEPNDYHKTIVSTDYQHIITTNYDSLLELAADEFGYNELLTRSYSYVDSKKISAAIYSNNTSIIHAHGKITDLRLDQFILTKQDYLNIMKHNPGFRLIMNAIFMTNSVLFVGYGGSDPHFEDIISDLNLSLNWDQSPNTLPKIYFMMLKDKITPIREHLNNTNRIDAISFNNFHEMLCFLQSLESSCPRKI